MRLKPLTDLWDWQVKAACRGMDVTVFFSPSYERGRARHLREERARAVCESCPVRVPCGRFALATRQDYGVWGGLTEGDRVGRPPAAAEPGPAAAGHRRGPVLTSRSTRARGTPGAKD
ncbi:WhiB family transcriptional regulator [Streptomyces sp. HPF1205]|uniref:WhiB family transcriptional regulator n=1 Tax=Streptomyces sp. HPF1205 TaxID=2873262 RepID=UPI001CED92C8|nr:WhiB family transcriptional regulator [Streptomyces sp. HPF1205]